MGSAGWAVAQPPAPSDWIKGRVVVETRAGLSDAGLAEVLKPHGGRSRRLGGSNLHVIDLPPGVSEQTVLAHLSRHPQLKFAELDHIVRPALVTNDPYLGSEWHLSKIGAATAWDRTMGAGVTIAILDTGVDASHPDLAANLVPGWNAFDNNSNSSDVLGHGTAVAGTAAAVGNNTLGVAGVAGSAKLMPIRISDLNGNASGSTIAQGLTYAADHGARVANISFAGVPGNATIQSAAQYMKSKGGLVVVAAGNNGVNENLTPTSTMIPVSATESTDLLASWSSFGSYVAVAAPGNSVWTTSRGGGYGSWWGTSFASPVAAGTVALMMAARPDLSNAQIESLLYASALDLGAAGRDIYYGFGRVNAAAAVAAAVNATAMDSQVPAVALTTPVGGASVSGLVAIDVAASDNVGVARVDLLVNGSVVASDSAAPYQFSWDSTRVANGTASLVAKAYDAAGNAQASSPVAVSVANALVADSTPPTVAIFSPGSGSKVQGTVQISAGANDNAGAAGIRQMLYIDGVLVANVAGGSLSYNWNTRKAASGSHALQVVATDAAGNRATAAVQVSK